MTSSTSRMVSAFDDDVEEIIIAGQGFQDKASFHRVSRNGSATEPMRFVIAYTVKMGEPNTTWPSTEQQDTDYD